MGLRVPYTQQFSPQQTPLRRLLPILRQNSGNTKKLRKAIGSAFFKDKTDPDKLAGNTLIALRYYNIITSPDSTLTDFGEQLIALQHEEGQAHALLAKHVLLKLDGLGIIETLREMKRADLKIALDTLPAELRQRSFEVSGNSSDLSGVLGWLREAKVLTDYSVNEAEYAALMSVQPALIDVLKDLTQQQIQFLRAMMALNVSDWYPYNAICKHAEALYAGEVTYNWKNIVSAVLEPLREAGFIELRKKLKQDQNTPGGRGGKPSDIKPTGKFESPVAEPLLSALYRAAGFTDIRTIRSMSLADIVKTIEQDADHNKRGKALKPTEGTSSVRVASISFFSMARC